MKDMNAEQLRSLLNHAMSSVRRSDLIGALTRQ